MDKKIEARIDEWTHAPYDEATQKEIQVLVDAGDEKELIDRFYKTLDFGTGGLRGVQGAGDNRMNIYTVMKVTQGLANYIIQNNGQNKGVVIGRDSRINSDIFAETVARVMIGNNIKVYYFDDIHPTPLVSYAIRKKRAVSGIMVTASHNPKEYNGYKVYWEDGSQVVPPHDKNIIDEVNKVSDLSQVKIVTLDEAKNGGMFEIIDEKIDAVYYDEIKTLSIHPEVIKSSGVKICYSPLHGTGYKMVPAGLKTFGFDEVVSVKEQAVPDGNFPTAPYPNPEIYQAMEMGMKQAKANGSDVFMATDPDADRIGVALKQDDDSDFLLLNGNQIASLLAYYVLSELKSTDKMPVNPRLVTTIVTTGLILDICDDLGVGYYEMLTGFKWIGFKVKEFESTDENYVFGCEESHGYNPAEFVRDKDAVSSACLFAELTAYYKSQGKSVVDVLNSLYTKYGYYRESQISIMMKGKDGAVEIQALLKSLRDNTPKTIGKYTVLTKKDILTDEVVDIQADKTIGKVGLPTSNVIALHLDNGAKIIARPSGTEPKIKFYFTTSAKPDGKYLDELIAKVNSDHEGLRKDFLAVMGLKK